MRDARCGCVHGHHGVHGGGCQRPGAARSDWIVRQAQIFREDGRLAGKSNGEVSLLLHKQRERGGEAVDKICLTDGAEFAVAKKSRETGRAEVRLRQLRIVAVAAEQVFPASVAAEQAAAVDFPLPANSVFFRSSNSFKSSEAAAASRR